MGRQAVVIKTAKIFPLTQLLFVFYPQCRGGSQRVLYIGFLRRFLAYQIKTKSKCSLKAEYLWDLDSLIFHLDSHKQKMNPVHLALWIM